MNFKSRIEQLKKDGNDVAQKIKNLLNKIDKNNENHEKAELDSDHNKFI